MHPGKTGYTVKQVFAIYLRDKFEEEKQGMWGVIIFFRWISILITPLFIRASITPTQVTLLSLLLTLSQPVCLLLDSPASYIYLAFVGYVFGILDCVDGDIARATQNYTRQGQYADFQVDVIHRMTTYITLGLLVQQSGGANSALIHNSLLIASVACLLAVSARLSRYYVALIFKRPDTTVVHKTDRGIFVKIEETVFFVLSGLDFCLPVLILVAGIFDKLQWLLAWLLLYSTIDFVYTQYANYRDL